MMKMYERVEANTALPSGKQSYAPLELAIQKFINHHCTVGDEYLVTTFDFHHALVGRGTMSHLGHTISVSAVGRILSSLGYKPIRINRRRGFSGIGLR